MSVQTHSILDHILDAPLKIATGGAGGLLLAFAARFYLSGSMVLAVLSGGIGAAIITYYAIQALFGAGMDRLGNAMQDKLGRTGQDRVEFIDQHHWALRHMFSLAVLFGVMLGFVLNPYTLLGLT